MAAADSTLNATKLKLKRRRRSNCTAPETVQRKRLARKASLIPDGLSALLQVDMDPYFREGSGGFLSPRIEKVRGRWNIADELIADFLDGLLVVPALALLTKTWRSPGSARARFRRPARGRAHQVVVALLTAIDWLEGASRRSKLTPIGEFMFERAMNLGVAEFVEV